MKLEDKLEKIKKKFTNKSSFLYSTYVWNFDKINPNSKGEDLYKRVKSKQTQLLNEVFKDYNDLNKNLEENGFTFTKNNKEMEEKMKELGIFFEIKNYWHKKVK